MDEVKCKYCAMLIPRDAKICPYCRKKNRRISQIDVSIGIFIVLIIFALSLYPDKNNNKTSTQSTLVSAPATTKDHPAPTRVHEDKLVLGDWALQRGDYGNYYIVGIVKNNSSQHFKYAQISFITYNGKGEQIGTSWANISDLEPRGTWKFKAHLTNEEVNTVKFSKITAF